MKNVKINQVKNQNNSQISRVLEFHNKLQTMVQTTFETLGTIHHFPREYDALFMLYIVKNIQNKHYKCTSYSKTTI